MATATKTETVTLVLTGEEAHALQRRLGASVPFVAESGANCDKSVYGLNDEVYFALKGADAPF